MVGYNSLNQDIELSDIIDSEFLTEISDFEYAGITGTAQTVGWKIVFFKSDKSLTVDAIRLFDIRNEFEIELCNKILERIEFPVNFNSKISDIYMIFDAGYSQNRYVEGCIRYHYMCSDDSRISFDISEGKLTGLEIIYNRAIINNVIE